jgi:DNA sulfur modification protein DndD
MIKSLSLKQFGKFRDRDFSFAPVTLFYGENEAGKTTLFDALLDSLCSPRGTTLSGKRLAARYGIRDKERFSRLAFEGEPCIMNEADFLNLFAVRSGMINLEIDKNSSWMNEVKASLFSGGIDPRAAAAKFTAEIGGGRVKGSLNTEAEKIRKELEILQAEHEKIMKERQACLDMEKNVREMNLRLRQKEEETAALKTELAELEKSLEQQSLIQKKKNAESVLCDITEGLRENAELKNYSRFTPEEQEKIRLQAGEVNTRKSEMEKTVSGEEEALRNRERFTAEKNRRSAGRDRAEKLKILAEGLSSQIVPREKLVREKTRIVWKKAPLAAAAAFFLAAILGGILGPAAYRLWFLGGGGFAAALLFMFSFSRRIWEDTSSLEAAISFVRESWKKETGEDAGRSYEEILGVFERARERARAEEENFQSIKIQADTHEEKIAGLALRSRQAEQAYEAARQKLKDMLDAAGVTRPEEYGARLATKTALQKRCAELEAKLRAACAENQAASIGALENLLTRRSAEISEKITEAELPPAGIQRMENLRRQKRLRLETILAEEKKNLEDFGRTDGTFRARFQGIPERVAACEKNIAEKKRRLGEIKQEIEAAKIAGEIFSALSEDAGVMLEELSREIGKIFSAFTGENRPVHLEGFSVDKACVCDASGRSAAAGKTPKDPEPGLMLSAGTRDAFLLAARLALARKLAGGGAGRRALIVLDEPFITLDRKRTGRALSVLKEFFNKTGWQIILFSKDEILKNQMAEVFGENFLAYELR